MSNCGGVGEVSGSFFGLAHIGLVVWVVVWVVVLVIEYGAGVLILLFRERLYGALDGY